MMITLSNDFHNTQATLRVIPEGDLLSPSQQRRAEKALCGMADCTCGVVRGEQPGIPDGWVIDRSRGNEWFIGPAQD